MKSSRYHRRAGSLVRTFVVAVATLAILLVCFSMYQYSQVTTPAHTARAGRLPVPGEMSPPPAIPGGQQTAGVTLESGAVIGASKNASITLYTGKDRDSKIELTVSDWSPKSGSDHEFTLRDPEIRMRTAEGNDVRVKADEGNLEARRKSGSGLEPQRGKLSGHVEIEFDRRSAEDKARLSEAERNQTREDDLVRLRSDVLEFDVEFGRLIIPGNLVLTARDAGLEARDLEVQFDQQERRVQSLRIERGGRIELLSQSEHLGISMANRDAGSKKQTLVDWMRESLQARIDAQAVDQAQKAEATRQADRTPAEKSDPALPVFRATQPPRSRKPARYVGRFEGDVDARQEVGDATQSRLQADWLEIVREMTLEDSKPEKKVANTRGKTGDSGESATTAPASERIVLTWTGKLMVTQASPDGAESQPPAPPSRLSAGGAPARLSHPEGDAICSRLVYLPASGDVQLSGEGNEPVVVRSLQQGTIVGETVSVTRVQDSIDVRVAGPGRLWEESGTPGSTPLSVADVAALGPANVQFAKGLQAQGRMLQKTTLDFTGSMATREYRMLDRVSFSGRTTLQQDKLSLEADTVDVAFAVAQSWRGVQQSIDRISGVGNVVMTQDKDRLTCEKIDIAMAAGPDRKPSVKSATAAGNVSALQGDRSLQASDRLIVDFESVPSKEVVQVSDTSPSSTHVKADAASQPLKFNSSTAPRRLRAFGNVSVIDPSQSLDLACEELDCKIASGKDIDIESAVLSGLEDRPASVKLETFSVTGRDITLDVANEWADVPGAGRMTIQSQKDLDGRKVSQPIPIAVTWTDGMTYRGRENRAVFSGHVHASSQTTTTFDCDDNLLVEFEDATPPPAKTRRDLLDAWGIRGPLSTFWPGAKPAAPIALRGLSKEPRYIEATGNAVAQTAERLPSSDVLKSRARISGPKLSLHLRSELSKLLIEGRGDLMLEDFQPARENISTSDALRSDLFSDASDSGPSKTLIKWRDRMWYDFGVEQTLFEGDVQLTHLSGAELDKVFGVPQGGTPNTSKGRRTFLTSDALTVDFTDAPRSARPQTDQRMGRISSDRLNRFRASGRVTLREEVDQFSLNADDVTYERPRKNLFIQGSPQRKAQLVRQRPGKLPDQMSAERIFFNLETGKIEISRMHGTGQ